MVIARLIAIIECTHIYIHISIDMCNVTCNNGVLIL